MRLALMCACVSVGLVFTVGEPISAGPAENAENRLWASTVRAWIKQGDYASASLWLKDYLRQSSDPDVAYTYLYCLYQNGDYKRLLRVARGRRFASVVAQPRGLLLVGLACWREDNRRGALISWAPLLRPYPDNDAAWECVRVAIASASRLERAPLVAALLRMLNQEKFATAFLQGLLAAARDQYDAAEKQLLEARSLHPKSRVVAVALREVYRHSGNVEGARLLDEQLATELRGEGEASSAADLMDKSTIINDIRSASSAIQPSRATYRLPWPASQIVFCASHAGELVSPHKGRGRFALDFFLPHGSPIVAARDGVVFEVRDHHAVFTDREFTTFILLDHGDGTWSRYYHLAGGTFRVRPGDFVRQGQVLAESGRTGRCQSRQLHFEVLRKAPWQFSGPKIYDRWESIPVDFEETRQRTPEDIPGHWLVSHNSGK